jgi:hypothetical protein
MKKWHLAFTAIALGLVVALSVQAARLTPAEKERRAAEVAAGKACSAECGEKYRKGPTGARAEGTAYEECMSSCLEKYRKRSKPDVK